MPWWTQLKTSIGHLPIRSYLSFALAVNDRNVHGSGKKTDQSKPLKKMTFQHPFSMMVTGPSGSIPVLTIVDNEDDTMNNMCVKYIEIGLSILEGEPVLIKLCL